MLKTHTRNEMTKLGKRVTMVLALVLCLVIAFASYKISSLDRDLTKANQNLSAVTDTVHALELKNGEIVEWNQSLILDKNQLSNRLEQEELDRKEIEKKLNSRISSLSNIISNFSMDTIFMVDTLEVIDDSTRLSEFRYADDWLTVSGRTLFSGIVSETHIDNLSVRVPITIGLTEDLKLFIHSPNPNVTIELMKNYIVDNSGVLKKRSRWSLGLYGGFGMQYGLLGKTIDFGPQFGIGVSYRIF